MPHKLFKSQLMIPMILLSLGIITRSIGWQNYGFGFDQAQILKGASQILTPDLVLIGPRTGPADMFTGPLIYYLHTFGLMIISNPTSIIFTTLAIHVITGAVWFLLSKKLFKKDLKMAYLSLVIWAISPYLISQDRIIWNPNLSFISASLVLLPLLSSIKSRDIDKSSLLLILVGSFLGYQAHFSGFIYIPILLILVIIYRNARTLKALLAVCLGTIASLIPTLIFDIRHNFLNIRGLISLTAQQTSSNSSILSNLIKQAYITIENVGKLSSLYLPQQVVITIGALTILALLTIYAKARSAYNTALMIWIIAFPLIFSFYSGGTPEYYYLMQLPAIILLIVDLASKSRIISFTFLGITIISAIISIRNSLITNSLGLSNQLKVAEYISTISKENRVKKISYLMPLGDTFGLKYLLEKIKVEDDGVVVEIELPIISSNPEKSFNTIGVYQRE